MNQRSDHQADTIVAISTPAGYSGIGVVRLSGPDALEILRKVFRPAKAGKTPAHHEAVYGTVVNPDTGRILDDGIALFLKGPESYTGEDTVELSLHGSPVVLDMVVEVLIRAGTRAATRGEFTRRAFLAGKLDLVQSEAVIDLIEAAGPVGALEARSRLDKALSRQVREIADALKDLLARIEAFIDFDEDEEEQAPDPLPALHSVLERMDRLCREAQSGRIRREGIRAAIVGKPNVGKSTLFNALLRTDRMIVTPIPGTTRDSVEEKVVMGGLSFVITDTAGIRQAGDSIEEQGIRRTLDRIEQSDLVIAVFDGSSPLDGDDRSVLEACKEKTAVVILNKQDLGVGIEVDDPLLARPENLCHRVSAKTGSGLDELRETLRQIGEQKARITGSEHVGSLNRRCGLLMEEARRPIQKLVEDARSDGVFNLEIVSLELRGALIPLEEITGERVDEGILQRIFERFCVGK